ncbi:MAG: decaprenyl-phosphate phosphoribosyltransferase [Thermomicrobiales bacterium]
MRAETTEMVVDRSPLAVGRALLSSLRPKQWTKNLLVFAALIFDLQLDDPGRVFVALAAFACFCVASGAVYLVNDLLDRESDRLHPTKRHRPIASGRLPERVAVVAAVASFLGAPLAALLLRPGFGLIIACYIALMLGYSIWIKHLVILDVFAISAGFVLRAAGGAVVLAIPISPWLYVCTVLLSLFLGFAKRRNEIRVLESVAALHRRNLDEYSVGLLDQLILLTAAATIMSYSLYTFTAAALPENHAMMLTIPFVLYGIFRYLLLVYVREEGGAPEQLLLSDRPLLISVGLWAAAVVAVLYGPLS